MIVTFHSDGAVAPAPLLACTAAWLCAWGHDVLCVDWNGAGSQLPRYLPPGPGPRRAGGLFGLVDDVLAGQRRPLHDYLDRPVLPLARGRLSVLRPGVGRLARAGRDQWERAYRAGLADFLDHGVDEWRADHRFILVNGGPGPVASRGVVLAHLPDVVVAMFDADAARRTADTLEAAERARDRLPLGRGRLTVVPVVVGDGPPDRAVTRLCTPWVRSWAARDLPPAAAVRGLAVTPDELAITSVPAAIAASETLAALFACEFEGTALIGHDRIGYVASAAGLDQSLEAPAVIEAARAIRPFLIELLPNETAAARIDRQLVGWLKSGGPAASPELWTILAGDAATDNWARGLVADESLRPPSVQSVRSDDADDVLRTRHSCPVDGNYVWYRPVVGEPVARCPDHGVELVPMGIELDDRGQL